MDSDVTMLVSAADQVRFDDTLLRFSSVFHKDLSEVLVQQARLICVNLAWNTQPYGLDPGALKQGQAAVARDVAKIYRSVDSIFAVIAAKDPRAAKAFFQAAKNGDRVTVARLLQDYGMANLKSCPFGPFDDGKLHRQNRNRRGRVQRRGPLYIVTDPRALQKYTKDRVAHVGTGKSAWATCAREIGGARGIPYWATKNRARGHVENQSQRPNDPRVVLHADVDYMDIICPPEMRRDAVEKQRNKMQASIKEAASRAARRSRLAA